MKPSWLTLGILGASWSQNEAKLAGDGGKLAADGAKLGQIGAKMSQNGFMISHLGAILGHLGSSWKFLGLSWALLGATWGHLGAILGHLGSILGASWWYLGMIFKVVYFRGNFRHAEEDILVTQLVFHRISGLQERPALCSGAYAVWAHTLLKSVV